jgi:multicomponent K+:H+ antiporter subunit E
MIPTPIVSLLIIALWLLLNGVSVGQAILALVIGIAAPLLTRKLTLAPASVKKPLVIARLIAVVCYDIIRANIDVARRILGPEAAIKPAFFWYPLTLTSSHGISTLAAIITMTPGTLTVDVSPDRQRLKVHAFHLDDEAAVIDEIRTRFERPLLEIFP